MDDIIRDENLRDTFAYVDDVTVCGYTLEEHDRNLLLFRQALEKYGLTLNEEKSTFRVKRVTILGHVIENNVIRPDPE